MVRIHNVLRHSACKVAGIEQNNLFVLEDNIGTLLRGHLCWDKRFAFLTLLLFLTDKMCFLEGLMLLTIFESLHKTPLPLRSFVKALDTFGHLGLG